MHLFRCAEHAGRACGLKQHCLLPQLSMGCNFCSCVCCRHARSHDCACYSFAWAVIMVAGHDGWPATRYITSIQSAAHIWSQIGCGLYIICYKCLEVRLRASICICHMGGRCTSHHGMMITKPQRPRVTLFTVEGYRSLCMEYTYVYNVCKECDHTTLHCIGN